MKNLKILTITGRELFTGTDYLPDTVERNAVMFTPGTGEEFRVVAAPKFKKGQDRTILVSERL